METEDPASRELFFGRLTAAMALYEQMHFQAGLGRATGQISPTAARAFAQELILAPDVESARAHMLQHPEAAVAFYEVGHTVCARFATKLSSKHTTSDGHHGPFVLIAAAVLNEVWEVADS